uniref:Uncharacterized protein n=1 Tax=Anguilla anguilla TaxID=7936 RepID=A0A0E9PWC8_ANGAN
MHSYFPLAKNPLVCSSGQWVEHDVRVGLAENAVSSEECRLHCDNGKINL